MVAISAVLESSDGDLMGNDSRGGRWGRTGAAFGGRRSRTW